MLYLYDVWVNWFEGEEKGYNVCHFHEWRKEDNIQILDQVPFLYITDQLYNYIENNLSPLPNRQLEVIHKRAYIRKGQRREPIEYACIVSDGKNVLAIDTVGYETPLKKSRLIPRQEKQALELLKRAKQFNFSFVKKEEEEKSDFIVLDQKYMFGLTRRERQLKKLMMMVLDQLRTSDNVEELRYWLTEWKPELFSEIKQMQGDEIWQTLYEDVIHGWGPKHESLCAQMIKGQPFLEEIWEKEQVKNKDTSHLK